MAGWENVLNYNDSMLTALSTGWLEEIQRWTPGSVTEQQAAVWKHVSDIWDIFSILHGKFGYFHLIIFNREKCKKNSEYIQNFLLLSPITFKEIKRLNFFHWSCLMFINNCSTRGVDLSTSSSTRACWTPKQRGAASRLSTSGATPPWRSGVHHPACSSLPSLNLRPDRRSGRELTSGWGRNNLMNHLPADLRDHPTPGNLAQTQARSYEKVLLQ